MACAANSDRRNTFGVALRPLRILYVEDNHDLRETIGMLIEADGREVVSCATGEEALAADRRRPFDVLVTDVSLPGMSGTDLARALLHDDPQRWVILCSGYEFAHGLAALGPNVRSLPKPFEVEEMDALLAEIAAAPRR
jgi:CheY-like chemotaxis protein